MFRINRVQRVRKGQRSEKMSGERCVWLGSYVEGLLVESDGVKVVYNSVLGRGRETAGTRIFMPLVGSVLEVK